LTPPVNHLATAQVPSDNQTIRPRFSSRLTRRSHPDCRAIGISDATFYNWRSKYGGMEVSDARRLKALEEENRRLKKLLAESMLDVSTLREALGKNF
jgi:hypothetical protein